MSFEAVITTIVGALTIIVSWLTVRVSRPKLAAETESLSVATMRDTLVYVRKELEIEQHARKALEERVAVLEVKLQAQQRGIDILRGQVRELGGVPRWPE